MVGAANYVGDAHIDVIDHHAELVHGLAEFFDGVGTQQHEVFDVVVGKFCFAKDHVIESGFAADRRFKADGRLGSRIRRITIAAAAAHHAANLSGAFGAVLGVVSACVLFSGAVTQKRGAVR